MNVVATVSVTLLPATTTVTCWGATGTTVKPCGAMIEPAGPMIESTWAAVKLLVWIGRSKVTWNLLTVSSLRRLSAVESWFEVPTACVETICGPGTISGRVVWLNGGLSMLWAVVNVIGATSWGVGTA